LNDADFSACVREVFGDFFGFAAARRCNQKHISALVITGTESVFGRVGSVNPNSARVFLMGLASKSKTEVWFFICLNLAMQGCFNCLDKALQNAVYGV
jgi:hypothetical protein